jgi:hypothetical protein
MSACLLSYLMGTLFILHASGQYHERSIEVSVLTLCSGKKLNKGQEVFFAAKLTNANQAIRAYTMCDAIGTCDLL